MSDDRRIVIVGAGLVGSLLASWLAKRGQPVLVLEKRPDLRSTPLPAGRSINLALAERGIHALAEAGVMEPVEPLLIPMRGRLLHDVDGGTEFQAYGSRPDEVIHSVSRTELNRVLLNAAQRDGCELRFNLACQQVDLSNRKLTVCDTRRDIVQEIDFQLVIGADGVASVIREAIIEHAGGEARIERLDHDYKELCLPAGPGGRHAMKREALHIWPRGGFMLIALPNLDGSFTVTLFLARQGEVSFAALEDSQAVTQFFRREFADAEQLIPEVAQQFQQNPTGPLGTVRCDTWHVDSRALILGDAAHAIVPFHGQGMNAGFEDCEMLIDCLNSGNDKWETALAQFVARRRPDADAIADMALENYVIMRDSVTDPRFQQKKSLGFELERRFPKQFIPRYSMVMFHRIPYAEVYRRGLIQDKLLDELIDHPLPTGKPDFALAEQLLRQVA